MVSEGPMPVFGSETPEKTVFCLKSGQWLTGRVEWLISCETGERGFPLEFTSGFRIGLLVADIAAFIGLLKISL